MIATASPRSAGRIGVWSTPGIHRPQRDPADAVVRECREETGLYTAPVRILGVFGSPRAPRDVPERRSDRVSDDSFDAKFAAACCGPFPTKRRMRRSSVLANCRSTPRRLGSAVCSRDSDRSRVGHFDAPSLATAANVIASGSSTSVTQTLFAVQPSRSRVRRGHRVLHPSFASPWSKIHRSETTALGSRCAERRKGCQSPAGAREDRGASRVRRQSDRWPSFPALAHV
jgi:hypothetical protein